MSEAGQLLRCEQQLGTRSSLSLSSEQEGVGVFLEQAGQLGEG